MDAVPERPATRLAQGTRPTTVEKSALIDYCLRALQI
jgi:hypothetical protein